MNERPRRRQSIVGLDVRVHTAVSEPRAVPQGIDQIVHAYFTHVLEQGYDQKLIEETVRKKSNPRNILNKLALLRSDIDVAKRHILEGERLSDMADNLHAQYGFSISEEALSAAVRRLMLRIWNIADPETQQRYPREAITNIQYASAPVVVRNPEESHLVRSEAAKLRWKTRMNGR